MNNMPQVTVTMDAVARAHSWRLERALSPNEFPNSLSILTSNQTQRHNHTFRARKDIDS
jgi:hypothetical protein